MARPRILTDGERICNRRASCIRHSLLHPERCRLRKRTWEVDHRDLRNTRQRCAYRVRKEAKVKADLEEEARVCARIAWEADRRAKRNARKRCIYHTRNAAKEMLKDLPPEHHDAPGQWDHGLDVLVDEGDVREAAA